MARAKSGIDWTELTAAVGVPVTLGLLLVSPPAAMATGAATLLAWMKRKDEEADFDRHSQELREQSERRERFESAVTSAIAAIERSVAAHGWQATLRWWVLGTSDFSAFECFAWDKPLPSDVYAIHLMRARKALFQAKAWVRDLRTRGRIPPLAEIPRDELLVTLAFAADTDFDPVDAVARYCVTRLFSRMGEPAGMKA